MLRREESLTTRGIAQNFIYGLEGCRLCSCCHLFALQAVIEFLCLLMLAALLSECCHEILVLDLEPVLVYFHIYVESDEEILITSRIILFSF